MKILYSVHIKDEFVGWIGIELMKKESGDVSLNVLCSPTLEINQVAMELEGEKLRPTRPQFELPDLATELAKRRKTR